MILYNAYPPPHQLNLQEERKLEHENNKRTSNK